MQKFFMIVLGTLIAMPICAQDCYFTLVKDSCWDHYNVTVNVLDDITSKTLMTIMVPEGTSWGRQKFECKADQSLAFSAQYYPVFWKQDEGKTYAGLHSMTLPATMPTGQTAWTFSLCFAKDFSEVPLPPDANGHCICNTKDIPPVKI